MRMVNASRNASEGIEPRDNYKAHGARDSTFLKPESITHLGERRIDVSGSKAAAGIRTVYIGTWEDRSVPRSHMRS